MPLTKEQKEAKKLEAEKLAAEKAAAEKAASEIGKKSNIKNDDIISLSKQHELICKKLQITISCYQITKLNESVSKNEKYLLTKAECKFVKNILSYDKRLLNDKSGLESELRKTKLSIKSLDNNNSLYDDSYETVLDENFEIGNYFYTIGFTSEGKNYSSRRCHMFVSPYEALAFYLRNAMKYYDREIEENVTYEIPLDSEKIRGFTKSLGIK